jgi:hypothetical protein
MSVIRVDVGPGDWVVVWSMGGKAPQLIAPEDVSFHVAASELCVLGPPAHLPENCAALACQVAAAWKKHQDQGEPPPPKELYTYDDEGYVLPRYNRLQELVDANKLVLVRRGPDEEKTIGLLCCDGSSHHPKRNKLTKLACRGFRHENYWRMHDHLRDERIIR